MLKVTGGEISGPWPSVTILSELLLLSKETKDKLSPKNLIFNLQLETSVLVLLAYILKKGRLFSGEVHSPSTSTESQNPEVDFWLFITFRSNVLFKSFHSRETVKLKCKKE